MYGVTEEWLLEGEFDEELFDKAQTIGEKIQTLRQSHFLSRKEFGDLIGIYQQNVREYEVGEMKPGRLMLKRICKAFPDRAEWLMEEYADEDTDSLSYRIRSIREETGLS